MPYVIVALVVLAVLAGVYLMLHHSLRERAAIESHIETLKYKRAIEEAQLELDLAEIKTEGSKDEYLKALNNYNSEFNPDKK